MLGGLHEESILLSHRVLRSRDIMFGFVVVEVHMQSFEILYVSDYM